jgi:tetratricopeptide (TPR) repeat protein
MSDVDIRLSAARQALMRRDHGSALVHLRAAACAPAPNFAAVDGVAQLYLELDHIDDAAEACARAIALDSNQTSAWRRLAAIELRRQRLAEACVAFENVVRLNPERAEAHSNFAGVLAMLGRYDTALAHAERAIALKPDFANPYVHAAFIEADRGNCEAALRWIDRIPGAEIRSAPILTARAEILIKFERYAAAYDNASDAAAKQPNYPDAQVCLGQVLSVFERDHEAMAALDRAIVLAPHNAEPVVRKGVLLMQLGRANEGLALLRHAQSLDTTSASVRYMRAAALDFLIDDEDIEATETLLAGTVSAVSDRMQLHFTLAGAYLRNGKAKKAFPHLSEANRLKRSLITYDADAEDRRVADIIAAFPKPLLQSPHSGLGEQAIFIVGMPRSGSTLMEQILSSHPTIHGGGELIDMEVVVQQRATAYGRPFPDFASSLSPTDLAAIGKDYLQRRKPLADGVRLGIDKLLSNRDYVGLIRLALPGARIIHCRRNPIDTGLSCYSKLFTIGHGFSYDLAEFARYYRGYETLMAHWRASLPSESFLEINYEDVVEDIEAAARKMIAFCGLPWDPACLRFHENARPVRTASMSQVRQPLYRSSVGRWREVEDELKPLIAALGT